jgi:hypothetical protein
MSAKANDLGARRAGAADGLPLLVQSFQQPNRLEEIEGKRLIPEPLFDGFLPHRHQRGGLLGSAYGGAQLCRSRSRARLGPARRRHGF